MSYRVSFRVERRHWNPHQVTSCNRFRLSESNRRKRFHVIQGRPFQSAFIVGFFFEFSIRVDSFLFTCHSVCFSFVVQIPLRNRFFFFCWNENEKKRKQPAGKPTPRDGSASRFCCCWWRKKEWKRNYGDSEREKRGQRAEMTSPRSDPNGFFEKKNIVRLEICNHFLEGNR